MTDTVPNYRWSASEFLRAWEAGAFDHRVELINGEVWPVVIGDWHGRCTTRVTRLLPAGDVELTTQTLPSGDSFPDPDLWVQRRSAAPVGVVGSRLPVWKPDDVLLVIEVSGETIMADLTTKARLYGSAGFGTYWVITPDALYQHTEPTPDGYRARMVFRAGEQVSVPYADVMLDVTELLGT